MSQNTDLSTLMAGYRLFCLAEGKRRRTIEWYESKLAIFQGYLRKRDLPTDAEQITIHHLRSFLIYLREEVRKGQNHPLKPIQEGGLSAQTIRGYARALRPFFNWAHREGYLQENPVRLLRVARAPQVIVQTLSDEQIRRLLAVIDHRTSVGFRDRCIILTLLDTGVRRSELANLTLSDLHLQDGYFKVMGKGRKERIVPIGARVQQDLWKYIKRHRAEPVHPNVDNVFLTRDGRPVKGDLMYHIMRRYGKKANLQGVRCSPHTLRHTFAKSFLLRGGDLFTLQKILGHSSLHVVRLYVNLTPEDVQVQHRKHSPVDAMKLRR